jgi:hypothetical protein
VDDVGSDLPHQAEQGHDRDGVGEWWLVVLLSTSHQTGDGPELAKAMHGDSCVVLAEGETGLRDRGHCDFVSAPLELVRQQSALDLRAADVWRVVVGCNQDAHLRDD